MTRGVNPDSIPRYEVPDYVYAEPDDEPETGSCWNCHHNAEFKVCGCFVNACVAERDSNGDGDVFECDYGVRDCKSWELQ